MSRGDLHFALAKLLHEYGTRGVLQALIDGVASCEDVNASQIADRHLKEARVALVTLCNDLERAEGFAGVTIGDGVEVVAQSKEDADG